MPATLSLRTIGATLIGLGRPYYGPSTTAKVASAFIKHGHLKTVTVVNPVNRCPTVAVPVEEVERFAAEYVSLFAPARQ